MFLLKDIIIGLVIGLLFIVSALGIIKKIKESDIPVGAPIEKVIPKTVPERTKEAVEATAGLDVPFVSDATLPDTPEFTDTSKKIRGRQLKKNLTLHEFNQVKNEMKNILSTRPTDISIQEQFAIEDIINFNCPKGFSVGEINGSISVTQIQTLLDGNCAIK